MDVDKIIADLISGAERAGARVERRENNGTEEKVAALGAAQRSALADAYAGGRTAALERFKVGFLGAVAPLIGSIAGPALARGAMGRVAPMAAKAIGTGLKGNLFDAAASTAGAMAGQKLTGSPVG
jgi:hypothetical protein